MATNSTMAGPYNTGSSGNSDWNSWIKTLLPGMYNSVNTSNTQDAWTSFVNSLAGADPTNNSRKWLDSQYGNQFQNYTATAANNNISWTDYLTNLTKDNSLNNQYSFTDPYTRSQGTDRPYAMNPTMRMVW